jgi:hypothetical protein
MVGGNLTEGLAALDVDNGRLMDALMKAEAQGRPNKVEWSGMEIAAVTKAESIRPALLPGRPQRVETDLEIVQVDVGGSVTQL